MAQLIEVTEAYIKNWLYPKEIYNRDNPRVNISFTQASGKDWMSISSTIKVYIPKGKLQRLKEITGYDLEVIDFRSGHWKFVFSRISAKRV